MNEDAGTFIETFFPEEKLSRAGRREKKGRPRTFEMHYWWSRKPLVVARAALLGATLPASFPPDQFETLVGLNAGEAPYKVILPDNESRCLRNLLKDQHGRNASILDPFAGGGSLPFAALELGLDVTANDYNPVAWLILKATLEYPGKYGRKLGEDVNRAMENVMHQLESVLGRLYPRRDGRVLDAYLYAWVVTCPRCHRPTPLVSKWQLAKYPDISRTFFIDPLWQKDTWIFNVKPGDATRLGTCARATGTCLHPDCGASIPNDVILAQMQAGTGECLMVTVGDDTSGAKYHAPRVADATVMQQAMQEFLAKRSTFERENLLPVEEMPLHTIRAAKYLKYWHALFNPRQLLFFAHFVRTVRAEVTQLVADRGLEYGRAVGAYLALFLGKLLDYNCRLTSWIPTREGILHACSNKLNALQWDHAEINPFSGGSGSLASAQKAILHGLTFAVDHFKQAQVRITNQSLFSLAGGAYDLILTDPPYFDDAPYGELSEFFHVWESRAIGQFFQDINPAYGVTITPKTEDLSVSFQRRARNFDTAFGKACIKMETLLRDDGVLVLFFAHTGLDAWVSVTRALQSARFQITAAWPVHTENTGISNWSKDSIYSSVILVARKRIEDKAGTTKEIQQQIQPLLETRLETLWKMGIRGADLMVSGIGATIGVFTRYAGANANSDAPDLKELLTWVKRYVEKFIGDKQ
jgi:putative DNA methylase